MPDSILLAVFLGLVLFFSLWYVVGAQRNSRIAKRALAWAQQGLQLIGEKATVQWSGSSSVELKISKAKDPFRSAELMVMLEPRELPMWWWWEHEHSRRDSLIFRAQLRAAPHFDLEAREQHVQLEQVLKHSGSDHWVPVQGGLANDMRADIRGTISPYAVNRLIVMTSLDGLKLTRLAVHRAVPNLEVHFLLPHFDQVSPPRVFTSLRQLAEDVMEI